MTKPIRKANFGARKPITTASPLVRTFFEVVDAEKRPYRSIYAKAGMHVSTLSRWRRGGQGPSLMEFERALQVIGYRLVLVNDEQGNQIWPSSIRSLPLKRE